MQPRDNERWPPHLWTATAVLLLSPLAVAAQTPAASDSTNTRDTVDQTGSVLALPALTVSGETGRADGLEELHTPALGVAIEADQIESINTINAEDAVRYAPNLIVRKRYIGDANSTLSFRNTHTTQTPRSLVTVDGFLISDFLGADFGTAPKWAVLGPSDIGRAEIIYGPTSARYSGNALGGVLRLDTRDITERKVRVNVQTFAQDYDYYDTDEHLLGYAVDTQLELPVGNDGGVALGYRHFNNDGQPQQWRTAAADSPFADQAIVDNGPGFPLRIAAQDSVVDSTEDQFRLRGEIGLNDNWRLRGLGALLVDQEERLNPESFLVDDAGRPTFVGISGVRQYASETTELLTGLGLEGRMAGWNMDVTVSRFETLDDRERQSNAADLNTGIIPRAGLVTDNESSWNNARVTGERGFGRHAIATGLSYRDYKGSSRTRTADDFLAATHLEPRNASGGQTRLLGVFVEDEWTLTEQFALTLGLRYERWRASDGFLVDGDNEVDYPARRLDAWSPKAALAFTPGRDTEIVFSAAKATRFPTIGELYQADLISFGPNVGALDLNGFNPDLGPERGVDLQLTGTRHFGNVAVTVSGYRQTVEDTLFSQTIILPDGVTGEPVSQSLVTNIGEVESWGADLVVAASDVLIYGLDVDANVSWNDTEVTENDLNPDLEGNQFPRVPEWRANASLRYGVSSRLDLATNFRYQNTPERNLENDSGSRCETYFCVSSFHFVDMKATVHLDSVDLDFGVDNVFNEKAFVFHPYPGRTFVAGLRYTGDF